MPKIINPDSISIESLTSKLNGLESQYTILSKNHSILQDSVQSLNQTILKADIATSFYDANLAFYTTVFSIIVTIVAAALATYNIFGIYRPIKSEFNKFKEEDVPNQISKIEENSKKEIKILTEINQELKDIAVDGNSWALKGMMNFYETKEDYSGVTLFTLRYCEHLIKFDLIREDYSNLYNYLAYTDSLVSERSISISDLQNYEDEIIDIFKLIFGCSDEKTIAMAVSCRSNLFTNNLPKSALDVAKSDELIPL